MGHQLPCPWPRQEAKGRASCSRPSRRCWRRTTTWPSTPWTTSARARQPNAPSARRSCTGAQPTWPQYGTPARTCSPRSCPANPEQDAGTLRSVPEWLCPGAALPRAASLIPCAWPRSAAVQAACPCSRLKRARRPPPPPWAYPAAAMAQGLATASWDRPHRACPRQGPRYHQQLGVSGQHQGAVKPQQASSC